MHGNVCEWCQDYYKNDYYKNSPLADPANLEASTYRVLRGGSSVSHVKYCRSAIRSYDDQSDRNDRYGFRIVCELE